MRDRDGYDIMNSVIFMQPMTLTLDLPPEILNRLTQAAIASGISLEDYATQVLQVSMPEIVQSASPDGLQPTVGHRADWIRQSREFRESITTTGPALSQTIIECRDGARY
jgi:hypothetical protein